MGSQVSSVEDLSPKLESWEGPNHVALILHNVFSPEECQSLIERSEKHGYEPALVNIGSGAQMRMDEIRSSNRSIIDDPILAQEIWSRIRKIINDDPKLLAPTWTPMFGKFEAVGLNERLRFLRYDQGHFFSTHQDGTYIRKHEAGESRVGERSLITCQLYLNEGFIGGSTGFESYHDRNHLRYDVIPKMGSILLFEHGLNHEGATLIEGRKYVIRTDVMYTDRGSPDYETDPIVLRSHEDEDGTYYDST
mmetsp:Transcript_35223/g.41551  ORF Transcript_35223/g.41551 Transcript_35223/m.41551 type:complete len:250 (-) Transcript_35223:245-994(-)